MLAQPSCKGETWTPALGDKTRYLASLDDGFGTGTQKAFGPDMLADGMIREVGRFGL